MKVLLVHNRYRHSGGEDEVVLRESELLRSSGHEVQEYIRHNSEIVEGGILSKAKMAMRTLWAWDSVSRLRSLLRREKPDVAHFHNTFPLISRDMARSGGCVHRLHGVFPSKIHPCRLAAREDFRETAFFRQGSWHETEYRQLRALSGSISTGKGRAYTSRGLRTLAKRNSSPHRGRWTAAR